MIKELTLEVTQKCLNNCIYCSSNSCMTKVDNTIDLNSCKKVLSEAKKIGVKKLNISGGEPFLHPNIMDIVKTTFDLKFDEIVIYSSGLYCPIVDGEYNSKAYSSIPLNYIQKCKGYNVSKIVFNMQCNDYEKHKRITGVYQTQTCRDMSISKCITTGIHTEVNIVPMKINIDEIYTTVKKAINLGCDKVNFLGLVMQGRAIEYKNLILMDEVDNTILQQLFNTIKSEFGDKVRIGNPLSDKSSEKCYAGKGRLSIRYDGKVFPCEAFKYKEESNGYHPLSIYDYSLQDIIMQSTYLHAIESYIDDCKDATCSDCPAQKNIGYKCAFDTTQTNLPNELKAESTQKSDEIFKEHMLGYLSTCLSDVTIITVDNTSISNGIKQELINNNYLFANMSAIDVTKSAHILSSKVSNQLKIYACNSIKITKELYYSIRNGNLINMRSYQFKPIDSNEYNLYLEPYVLPDAILSKEGKDAFIDEYLDSVTYPNKCTIKHSLAVSMNSYFESKLINKGFKLVNDSGIYKIYAYVVPNQFCRKNILELMEEL